MKLMDKATLIDKCAKHSAGLKFGHYMGGSNQPKGLDLVSVALPLMLLFPEDAKSIITDLIAAEACHFQQRKESFQNTMKEEQ
jgi:hypothetical protein